MYRSNSFKYERKSPGLGLKLKTLDPPPPAATTATAVELVKQQQQQRSAAKVIQSQQVQVVKKIRNIWSHNCKITWFDTIELSLVESLFYQQAVEAD